MVQISLVSWPSSVILWGFSLFLHHSSLEFSKRVNRPLGKRGTSVSTSTRLSKALSQLGTIPRETFPAGRELSLQPLHPHMLKSYHFDAFGINFFRKPFLMPPTSWVPPSFEWQEHFACPLAAYRTVYIYAAPLLCVQSSYQANSKRQKLDLISGTLQCLEQGCTNNRLIINNQQIEYI